MLTIGNSKAKLERRKTWKEKEGHMAGTEARNKERRREGQIEAGGKIHRWKQRVSKDTSKEEEKERWMTQGKKI